MRKIIHKVFFAWDFDKEEKWLNELAAKGLSLIGVGLFRYEFEETLPGEYSYKLELLEKNINHPESQQYLAFLEETGAEHVGSWIRWAYLRKKRSEGEFELFSDNASRAKHLVRILTLIGIIGALNLLAFFYNLTIFFIFHNSLSLFSLLNLLLALLSTFGFIRLWRKRKKLKTEQSLFE